MQIRTKRTEETTWQQVQEMARAGALHVGDEILDQMIDGEKITHVVAHITPDEVHFVSKNCLKRTFFWNENGSNAGGFMESDLCKWLNEVTWNLLPEGLKAVISERECLQIVDGEEERFPLKLWLPTEYEVFADDWASGAKEGEQFEIFKDPRNRVKLAGEDGGRANWWLLSVMGGSSTSACYVNTSGDASSSGCTTALRVPVCFTIKIKE